MTKLKSSIIKLTLLVFFLSANYACESETPAEKDDDIENKELGELIIGT